MKDFGALMKQAQAMQQTLAASQAELAGLVLVGTAGGGVVKVTLKGTGELARVEIGRASCRERGAGAQVGAARGAGAA